MATITTDTFLDGGVARTAGEVWAMNGGILTVRTDTRWHSDSPASMTGSFGAMTISATLGGGVLFDGRNVRQVLFNTGSGVVPAIGTIITQGGVSGYFLGAWADLTSAPTAVAAAMPTNGFIKFREVTGGAFSAGALTGIGASATQADTTSWIEIVQRQAVANTVPRLGFYRTRGDFFYLDETTGAAGQVIQTPTNGGGIGTHVPAVWIETAAGSNEFEIYPCIRDTWYNDTNLSTDIRSKFCQTIGTGQVRIGFDGTNNAGFVPPVGCRVRIPNVIGRQSTLALGDANNQTPSTGLGARPDFTTTSAGDIDFEYFMNDWYHLFVSPFKVRMINVATFDAHSTSNEASPTELDNYACGAYIAGQTFTGTNNSLGGTVSNCRFVRPDAAASGHSMSLTGCSNYTFTSTRTGVVTYARSSGSVSFNQCRNIIFNDFISYCATLAFTTCSNILVQNFNYIDRIVGVTNSTTPKYALACATSSDNIRVDGVILSFVGELGPYLGVFQAANCSNLTFRNVGTYAVPVDVNAAFAPAYILVDSGNNDGVRVQRCYLEVTRTNNFLTSSASKNISIENCSGTTGAAQILSANSSVKGVRTSSNSTIGGISVYGSHWFDLFDSDTQGRVWLAFNEPTAFTASQFEAVSLGASAGFTSAGQISMPNLGDQIIFTMPYFAIGHTAFDNSAPVLTGANTGNFSYEYDIDTGTGFSAVYKTLNAANLITETLVPATGFKLRYRITTVTANAANALTYIRVTTDSTSVAQEAALYNLDTSTISLTGLRAGSRVQIYDITNSIEIFNEIVPGTTLSYAAPYFADYTARVRVMYATAATADIFIEFSDLVDSVGLSRMIFPEIDSVYVANGVDGFSITDISIVDNLFLVEVDTPTISWGNIYAYGVAWLFSAAGIRDEGQFVEALDRANYVFTDFKIKNVSFPSIPLSITGGWGRDSVTDLTVTMIDITGGTIFSSPDLVIPYASGLSAAQDATLSKIDTLTEDATGLRFTTKALETAGGSSLTLGSIAEAVWDEALSAHLTAGSTGAALDESSTLSPSVVALAVRSELTAELGRIDVATSTRLSTASYVAAPTAVANAAAVRTNLTVELARIDVATSTRNSVTPPTSTENANAVWDKPVSQNVITGSFGWFVQKLLTVAKFIGLK